MEKPYIEKIDTRGDIDIWLVDGKYIRDNMDPEFTNFSHHYIFSFIPQNEFWIDREHNKGEVDFFIDHMLIEHRLMSEKKDKSCAMDMGDRVERRERKNSQLFKEIRRDDVDKEELIKKIHKELLKEYSKNINVWVVNGELVRDFFYIDFTEGGHDRVYPFVPEKEVWLDDDLNPNERKFVLLHEIHERNLMPDNQQIHIQSGMLKEDANYTKVYGSAHKSASKLEYLCRHHPEKLEEKLKEEIDKI